MSLTINNFQNLLNAHHEKCHGWPHEQKAITRTAISNDAGHQHYKCDYLTGHTHPDFIHPGNADNQFIFHTKRFRKSQSFDKVQYI